MLRFGFMTSLKIFAEVRRESADICYIKFTFSRPICALRHKCKERLYYQDEKNRKDFSERLRALFRNTAAKMSMSEAIIEYVTDKFKGVKYADIAVPDGGSFDDFMP